MKVRPNGLREVYLQVGCLGRTFVSAISAKSLVTTAGFLLFFLVFVSEARFCFIIIIFSAKRYFLYFCLIFQYQMFLFSTSISILQTPIKKCVFFCMFYSKKFARFKKKQYFCTLLCIYNTHSDFLQRFSSKKINTRKEP